VAVSPRRLGRAGWHRRFVTADLVLLIVWQ
jgi:hypothetical protein